MELEQYLAQRGESQVGFARRARVSQSVVNAIILARRLRRLPGVGGCTTTNAYRIVLASLSEPTDSGGFVSFEDLVPPSEKPVRLDELASRVRARRRADEPAEL
jgi:hypothetical protein